LKKGGIIMNFLKRLIIEEEGQGMTEYALVLAVIAIGIVGTVSLFKDEIVGLWENMTDKIEAEATKVTPTP
jgi:pilus assembly protein Flp/PilA